MTTFTRVATLAAVLFSILNMSPAAAQTDDPCELTFEDPKPQHYRLTARASEIDPRVKPHPDIGFLIESKGKPADTQHASVDTRIAPRGKLVIWLMGHNEELFDRLNSYGLHAIRVHYANKWFSICCQENPVGENCRGNIRLEAATGEDFSKDVDIPKPDGMMERAFQFVKWLDKTNPQSGWAHFLTEDGTGLRWDDVIIAGSSHGSTTAARFAKHQKVGRVVAFCGPRDQFQIWQSQPSATPENRYFGFSHTLDGGWTSDHYCRSWELLGMHKFGPIVNVDQQAAPFGNSRRLITAFDVGGDAKRAHSSVQPGKRAFQHNGRYMHEDVWRYLFTHPVELVGEAVPVDPSCLKNQRSAFETKQVPKFRDQTAELGLELSNSAACWVDLNNDGWPELCSGGTVWRNHAGKRFTKLAEGLGEVVAADFDNDGFNDLFSYSTMKLFRNQHGKAFVPVELPELPPCISLGATWGDFNGDGLADLYVGGYEDWGKQITYPDLLLLNEGGASFKLAWSNHQFRARGVTACDFDHDGDLDVYVSNYRLQPNNLWINDGTAKFSDGAAKHNAIGTTAPFSGGHSIGSAWGDFDNDGLIDLFVGNFAHRDSRGDQPQSHFLKNLGSANEHALEDHGTGGIFYQESYATPAVGDYDNDGDLDLFFTTVYETASFGKKNNAVLYRNQGAFQFDDATLEAQVADLPATYQAAWADFDRDGDLDLVTAGKLFQNDTVPRHWLAVRLIGDGKTVNRSAIGAQVRISLNDQILTRHVEAGTGQGNQNDLTLHFGIGDHAQPVNLEISWPTGVTQSVANVAVDQFVSVPFEKHP